MADVARKDRLVADHRKGAAKFRSEIEKRRPRTRAVAARQDRRQRREPELVGEPLQRQVFPERDEVVLVIDRRERPVARDQRERCCAP
jgi:hypothetical protein